MNRRYHQHDGEEHDHHLLTRGQLGAHLLERHLRDHANHDDEAVAALANIDDFVEHGKASLAPEDVANLKAMLTLDVALIAPRLLAARAASAPAETPPADLKAAVRDAVADAVDMGYWGVVDLDILTARLHAAGVRVGVPSDPGDAGLREALDRVFAALDARYEASSDPVFRGAISLAIGDVLDIRAALSPDPAAPQPEAGSLRDALLRYVAVDGSYGMFDARALHEAREMVARYVSAADILREQDRIRALLSPDPAAPEDKR